MTLEEQNQEASVLLKALSVDPIPALNVWPGDTLFFGNELKKVVSVTKVNDVTRSKDVRLKVSDGLHEQEVDFDVTHVVFKLVYSFGK
jgi:hypothetical protein